MQPAVTHAYDTEMRLCSTLTPVTGATALDSGGRVRRWRPGWPCSVAAQLTPWRRGPGDPTYAVTPDGAHWRARRTPEGAATIRVAHEGEDVVATAWGPGADWALEQLPRLLGADDDPSGFEPQHEVIERLWRRHRNLRIGAGDLVMEALVPAVLEQKVTGKEAFGAYRALVRRFGERAPGPAEAPPLFVPPEPSTLRTLPSWEWLKLPVDGGRSRPIVQAAGQADALERAGVRGPEDLDRRLRAIPRVGRWTSAEVRTRALGDADAVSFGDYHLPTQVGLALAGEPIDDSGLAELLRPYGGHRQRVIRLVMLAGPWRERRGPRLAQRVHLPNVRQHWVHSE